MKHTLDLKGLRPWIRSLRLLVTLVGVAAVGAALWDQLRRRAGERTWHGEVFGFIPYDFRVPTLRKLMQSCWDPNADHLLKGKAFGVGWDFNAAPLSKAFSRARGE